MSNFLDELPYILRKHTLRDEMSEVDEQAELFKRASKKKDSFVFSNILAVVTESLTGLKALRTAMDFAREFSCELSIISPANLSEKTLSILKSSGLLHTVLPKSHTIDRDVIFLQRKHKFDLVIVPEKFTEKLKGLSVASFQIAKGADCAVLVVK